MGYSIKDLKNLHQLIPNEFDIVETTKLSSSLTLMNALLMLIFAYSDIKGVTRIKRSTLACNCIRDYRHEYVETIYVIEEHIQALERSGLIGRDPEDYDYIRITFKGQLVVKPLIEHWVTYGLLKDYKYHEELDKV